MTWSDTLAAEAIASFCKSYGADTLEEAINERNRPLYKARFEKALRTAIDKKLDRDIAESVKSII